MVSITRPVAQVKADLPQFIEHYVAAGLVEVEWTWRDRVLSPHRTVLLFVMQVLHGNTAIDHLRHLAGMQCSATAYCKARKRLPRELIEKVSGWISRAVSSACDGEMGRMTKPRQTLKQQQT